MITIYIPGLSLRSYEFRRGDAQIIHDDRKNAIVIDGGESDLCNKLIAYCRSKGITHVTYILTHWHIDHDAGMKQFLEVSGICVDHIYCPPPSELKGLQESGSGDDYNRACRRIALAQKLRKVITYPIAGVQTEIVVGDIRCRIWRRKANKGDYNDYEINNTSLVTYFPDLRYLTSGDTINSFDIYLSTFKEPVVAFKIPHHGNACTTNPCEKLKKYGAQFCWYNDFEPSGSAIGSTGFSKFGAGYCKKYFVTVRTDIDLWMIADAGKLTITKGSTHWTYDIPYNKGGWEEHDQGWKYKRGDGTYCMDGWFEIDGKWYVFDKDGYRIIGWVKADDGLYRYCHPYMFTSQFLVLTDGTTYYLDAYGRRIDGQWYQVDSKWYCFDEDGKMRTGWYTDPELGLRYLEPTKGYMYTNTTANIDGIDYRFDGYGRVTELSQPPIVPNEGFRGYNVSKRTQPISFIVMHYVGAESTAADNVAYFNKADRQASADYFVGHAGEICEYNPDVAKQYSWHCGGGRQSSQGGSYYGICTNGNSIGVEMCCKKSNGKWTFSALTLDAAVRLVKWLMGEYNIPLDHVIRHYDVTGKVCPGVSGWTAPDAEWIAWKSRLTDDVPALPYRVRKSWADAKSQIGAFNSLDNAKAMAKKNAGYHVYDANGKEII